MDSQRIQRILKKVSKIRGVYVESPEIENKLALEFWRLAQEERQIILNCLKKKDFPKDV